MQKRQTLAWRRPARALGRVGTLGCTKTVPKGHRTQADSSAHQRIRSAGALEIGSCQKKKGVVEWVAREPLVSTEIRAFPLGHVRGSYYPVKYTDSGHFCKAVREIRQDWKCATGDFGRP